MIWSASIKGIQSRLRSSSLKRGAEYKVFGKSLRSPWEGYEVQASQGKAGTNCHLICNGSVGLLGVGHIKIH